MSVANLLNFSYTSNTQIHSNNCDPLGCVDPSTNIVTSLSTPCVYYCANFLSNRADQLLDDLKRLKWVSNKKVARSTAVYGDKGVDYSYHRGYASSEVSEWTPQLLQIKQLAEEWYTQRTGRPVSFNVCLANRYDNGSQSLGWHADREEIDRAMGGPRLTPIASISLGCERLFGFKAKDGSNDRTTLRLGHGSLTIMENICQLLYKHSLLPEAARDTTRINLTFRCKKSVTELAVPNLSCFPKQIQSQFNTTQQKQKTHFIEQGWRREKDSDFQDAISTPFDCPFVVGTHGKCIDEVCNKWYHWLCAQTSIIHYITAQIKGGHRIITHSSNMNYNMVLAAIAFLPVPNSVLAPLPCTENHKSANHHSSEQLQQQPKQWMTKDASTITTTTVTQMSTSSSTTSEAQDVVGQTNRAQFFTGSEYKIADSHFICLFKWLIGVNTHNEALFILNAVKEQYPGAGHYAHAMIRGNGTVVLSSDDGEPKNSAAFFLKNNIITSLRNLHTPLPLTVSCLCVVVRYFGGTLLGLKKLKEVYDTQSQQGVQQFLACVPLPLCDEITVPTEEGESAKADAMHYKATLTGSGSGTVLPESKKKPKKKNRLQM